MEFWSYRFMDERFVRSRRDDMFEKTFLTPPVRTPSGAAHVKRSIFLRILAIVLWSALLAFPHDACAIGGESLVRFVKGKGGFPLSVLGKSASICVSSKDYSGVQLVLTKYFRSDIEQVTGTRPEILVDSVPQSKEVVIVGTIGRSPLIDELVKEKKIDVNGVAGQWEAFLIQSVDKPFGGVDRALVIAGSDKRGTIYGMFTISGQIGVSPWHWWADVPVKHHDSLFILPGRHVDGPPSVKYRGIFLNDEWPALTNWVMAKYGMVQPSSDPPIPPGVGNYGHEFYERIFEVLLRLKANYLWPAMWNNAFNEDDTLNARLADEYGIVMGTSHQEPMLRAQKEWDRRYRNTLGSWNYAKYPDVMEHFWREGVRRNRNYESIITIGLRGVDDTPMAPGGPEANKALLEKIVNVQRAIIAEEINPDVTKVPQMWCLYKEVQDFYDAGMRVPDDVTLLWAEDNWGNIRRLPTAAERKRSGGAGIYYHFDYHGGPRSYQWINTNPIPKIWDQMSLAKQYGADRIWIVNVGHFKGYEFPTEFFMSLAWDTNRWTNDNLDEYTRLWSEREFGSRYAADIADIITRYAMYNGRRKPELLSPSTYSFVNYREAERVVSDYNGIAAKAEAIYDRLPEDTRDAFYELVLFPTKASAILNELYCDAGLNALYAKQKRAATNDTAARTRELFAADTAMMGYFNREFAGGKWNHFMDQTHLGYTNWQDPSTNSLRAIDLKEIELPNTAEMGVAIEGSENAWPDTTEKGVLPTFDPFSRERRYVEIFNRGNVPFDFSAEADKPWIDVSSPSGEVAKQTRLWIGVDWTKVPVGRSSGSVRITGSNREVVVDVNAFNPVEITRDSLSGFVEGGGYVSIEAEHFTKKTDIGESRWMKIEDYGHTMSGMRAAGVVDAPPAVPRKDSPSLEYRMYLFSSGKINVDGVFGPTLNFMRGRGLRYAVSFDDETPQTATLVQADYNAQNGNRDWEISVMNNGRVGRTAHTILSPGYHTLKIWMIDPGVVLEKLVVDCRQTPLSLSDRPRRSVETDGTDSASGGVKPSYLGPPESYWNKPAVQK